MLHLLPSYHNNIVRLVQYTLRKQCLLQSLFLHCSDLLGLMMDCYYHLEPIDFFVKTNFKYFVPFCGFSKDPIKLSLPNFGQNDWSTHFMEYLSKYTWVHCAHHIFSSSFGLEVKITQVTEFDKCLSKYTCV